MNVLINFSNWENTPTIAQYFPLFLNGECYAEEQQASMLFSLILSETVESSCLNLQSTACKENTLTITLSMSSTGHWF